MTSRRLGVLRRTRHDVADSDVVDTRKRRKHGTYEPLDPNGRAIRLFNLLPGKTDDPLCGKLETISLDESPRFDAVSYVWGDICSRFQIIIDEDRSLMVPESLRPTLIALRLEDEMRALWIDAICINQDDVQERGHQVRLMQAIYSTAQCVRIWLNVDVDLQSPAFHAVSQLKFPNSHYFDQQATKYETDQEIRLRDRDPIFWGPLFDIFANEYWRRVWTQQELYLACSLQFHTPRGSLCPNTLIKFDRAVFIEHVRVDNNGAIRPNERYETRMFSRSLFQTIYDGLKLVKGAERRLDKRKDATSLLRLFLNSAYLSTTDPKDRVYGLLGLSRDCSEGEIIPDYTLSLYEVYGQVIQHSIQKHRSLDFLCNYALAVDHSFPSWLPSPEKQSRILFEQLHISNTANIVIEPLVKIYGRILSVQGIKCDIIQACAATSSVEQPILAWWKSLEDICVDCGICNATNEALSCKKVLELLGFWTSDNRYFRIFKKPKPTLEELQQGIRNLLRLPEKIEVKNISLDDIALTKTIEIDEFDMHIARALRFGLGSMAQNFGTQRQRIGTVYPSCDVCSAMKGDEVWALFGCKMPIVLRPNQDGTYKVIGPAAVPGLMNGEACKGILENGVPGPEYYGPDVVTVDLV